MDAYLDGDPLLAAAVLGTLGVRDEGDPPVRETTTGVDPARRTIVGSAIFKYSTPTLEYAPSQLRQFDITAIWEEAAAQFGIPLTQLQSKFFAASGVAVTKDAYGNPVQTIIWPPLPGTGSPIEASMEADAVLPSFINVENTGALDADITFTVTFFAGPNV
jgi:hypothetical protein